MTAGAREAQRRRDWKRRKRKAAGIGAGVPVRWCVEVIEDDRPSVLVDAFPDPDDALAFARDWAAFRGARAEGRGRWRFRRTPPQWLVVRPERIYIAPQTKQEAMNAQTR